MTLLVWGDLGRWGLERGSELIGKKVERKVGNPATLHLFASRLPQRAAPSTIHRPQSNEPSDPEHKPPKLWAKISLFSYKAIASRALLQQRETEQHRMYPTSLPCDTERMLERSSSMGKDSWTHSNKLDPAQWPTESMGPIYMSMNSSFSIFSVTPLPWSHKRRFMDP